MRYFDMMIGFFQVLRNIIFLFITISTEYFAIVGNEKMFLKKKEKSPFN